MPGYLRFRRTARIAPGIRLNLSKRGVSTSFGPRGFHYTVGHNRRRTTVGLPGTGLSYTTYSPTHARQSRQRTQPQQGPTAVAQPPGFAQVRGRGPSSSTQPTRTDDSAAWTLRRLAALTPPQKIAWGVVLTLLVITSPVGLWLLVAGLWQLHVPEWRIRTFVRQASLEPANAAELLSLAAAVDPHSPEVLGPLAELRFVQGDVGAALPLYREYCQKVPTDSLAKRHLAIAALKCNQVDEAIMQLVAIRQADSVTGDSMASVTAHLAYAYLCKEDPQQALSLIENGWANASSGGPGGEQCLFYHGIAEYMLGRTTTAVQVLDRLYAVNPTYEGLQAVKDAMVAGTYELLLPDGSALVPVTPGHMTRSVVKVQRTAPRSPHCMDCQAPLPLGAAECPYCHAAVGATAHVGDGPPPPPPPI